MASESFIDAWVAYREAVRRFYDLAEPVLNERRELDGEEIEAADDLLGQAAERSAVLTNVGLAQLSELSGPDYERIAQPLLAAAAVDVAIACESLLISPERPSGDPLFMTQLQGTPAESALALLYDADELVRELGTAAGAGSDPARTELRQTTHASFDALLRDASDPALSFAGGLVSAAAGGFLAPTGAEPLGSLNQLASEVGRFKRHVVRLLASGYEKLLGVSGQSAEYLVERSGSLLSEQAVSFVQKRVLSMVSGLLGWLVRRDDAERQTDTEIARPQVLPAREAGDVTYALHRLTSAYAKEMLWTGRIAKWLSWAAPLISTLGAPVGGPVLVAALDGVGVGFVLYTVDVRVDGHGLPARVDSVVKIVTDGLTHLT